MNARCFGLNRALFGLALLLCGGAAQAQVSDDVVRIGVLTDMSGMYSANAGKGMVVVTRMAVADHGGKVLGKPIEIIFADHQNKPDIASSIAAKWYDADKVDAIADVMGSAPAFAVQHVANSKHRILLISGAGASDLTGKSCSAYSAHWTWDTYSYAKLLASALVKRRFDSWFFITVDTSYGQQLERDISGFVKASGGKIIGSVRHPSGATDFSSFIIQAQASKAKLIMLANAGPDTVNALKQAEEFGIGPAEGQQIAAVSATREVHAMGLQAAQGILVPVAFYWDRDDSTRAFAKRYEAEMHTLPSDFHAGMYSAINHYLNAIAAAGTDQPDAVMKEMRALPVHDFFAPNGRLRADGRMVHDLYLMQVKTPAESKGEWDVFKRLATVPGDEAFRPMSEGGCPLVSAAR